MENRMHEFVVVRRSILAALDRAFRAFVPVCLLFLLNGCASTSYYGQLMQGQWQLLQAREPVAQVIADPSRQPALREQLQRSQAARDFASEHLYLPDNRSYRLYADIGRPLVVWNVFATPEFSLAAHTHCFPIAGCLAYRGAAETGRPGCLHRWRRSLLDPGLVRRPDSQHHAGVGRRAPGHVDLP
jgi:predicted aminopeptidase